MLYRDAQWNYQWGLNNNEIVENKKSTIIVTI